MAEEFIIKSQNIEDKINQLLPSQGGFQAGVDFSASTMVIPIIDLTETAEGSNLRQDLQTALSHDAVTSFFVKNATSTLINTTGYFRVFGNLTVEGSGSTGTSKLVLNDGASDKIIWGSDLIAGATTSIYSLNFDFIVKLSAGDLLKATSHANSDRFLGSTRQIADLQGNLVNP